MSNLHILTIHIPNLEIDGDCCTDNEGVTVELDITGAEFCKLFVATSLPISLEDNYLILYFVRLNRCSRGFDEG